MTVKGDSIVCNCRECFGAHGFAVVLSRRGDVWECERDSSHRYKLVDGFMKAAASKQLF